MYLSQFNQGRKPAERILRHSRGCYCIIHFGLNTYTDREWGYGDEDPRMFAPARFNAENIVRTCRECGFDGLILVCKHHDGFCLWQTESTEYNISKSPFRDGKGDLVREFSDACRKYGMAMGFYVSPWDRNHPAYGTMEYLAVYRRQLREIYANYGPAFEAWFDGANGGDGYYGGARETRKIANDTYYDWPNTWKIVRESQPHAAIFSDAGPDLRWVGNERGFADPEAFGCYTPHSPESGKAPVPGGTCGEEGEKGHADGLYYMPPECDVPLRRGWFYHASEDGTQKSTARLIEIYLHSVGCGGYLNLGLAPNQEGCLAPEDVKRLHEFKAAVDALFANPQFSGTFRGNGTEALLEFNGVKSFNLLELAEPIEEGEQILDYEMLLRDYDGTFQPLLNGKAIGRKRLKKLSGKFAGNALLFRLRKGTMPVSGIHINGYDAIFPQNEEFPIKNRRTRPDYLPLVPVIKGFEWTCDQGKVLTLKGFSFTPDSALPPGTPDHYELYVSMDGQSWTLTATGEFANIKANPVPQNIMLTEAVKARYCRFRATRMAIPGDLLSGLEFGVYYV